MHRGHGGEKTHIARLAPIKRCEIMIGFVRHIHSNTVIENTGAIGEIGYLVGKIDLDEIRKTMDVVNLFPSNSRG